MKPVKGEMDIKKITQEMEILSPLRHENTIQMLDSFETKADFCVVTEFAQGELFEILEDDQSLPEEVVQSIAKQLGHEAPKHPNRLRGRSQAVDMKPQNILIGSGGVVKLCDFGFARAMSCNTMVLTSIKGTPLYMAPELVQEQPYNHTVDLWSLGVILYELFVGQPPFYTNSIYSLIAHIVKDPVKFPTNITAEFKSFLKGLLNKKPSDRLGWPELLNHPFVRETDEERLTREKAVADAVEVAGSSKAWRGEDGAVAGAVLAVQSGNNLVRGSTPNTPPAQAAQTPQVTRRDPTRRLPGGLGTRKENVPVAAKTSTARPSSSMAGTALTGTTPPPRSSNAAAATPGSINKTASSAAARSTSGASASSVAQVASSLEKLSLTADTAAMSPEAVKGLLSDGHTLSALLAALKPPSDAAACSKWLLSPHLPRHLHLASLLLQQSDGRPESISLQRAVVSVGTAAGSASPVCNEVVLASVECFKQAEANIAKDKTTFCFKQAKANIAKEMNTFVSLDSELPESVVLASVVCFKQAKADIAKEMNTFVSLDSELPESCFKRAKANIAKEKATFVSLDSELLESVVLASVECFKQAKANIAKEMTTFVLLDSELPESVVLASVECFKQADANIAKEKATFMSLDSEQPGCVVLALVECFKQAEANIAKEKTILVLLDGELPESVVLALVECFKQAEANIVKDKTILVLLDGELSESVVLASVECFKQAEAIIIKEKTILVLLDGELSESVVLASVVCFKQAKANIAKEMTTFVSLDSELPESVVLASVECFKQAEANIAKKKATFVSLDSEQPGCVVLALVECFKQAEANIAKEKTILVLLDGELPESVVLASVECFKQAEANIVKEKTILVLLDSELPESVVLASVECFKQAEANIAKEKTILVLLDEAYKFYNGQLTEKAYKFYTDQLPGGAHGAGGTAASASKRVASRDSWRSYAAACAALAEGVSRAQSCIAVGMRGPALRQAEDLLNAAVNLNLGQQLCAVVEGMRLDNSTAAKGTGAVAAATLSSGDAL
eukprot:gene11883-14988_t